MGSLGSLTDQLAQTHGPVLPCWGSVPSTVMGAESYSEAVFFPLRLTQERVVFSNPKRNEKKSYRNFFS